MIKGIYLGAAKARHPNYNIVYNDVRSDYKPDILDDMLNINLNDYDYIIATPPCNYWSKANRTYETSEYALKTKHLLPCIIQKLCNQNKPFIIENVRNKPRFEKNGIFYLINCYENVFIYYVGRHMYITNIMINLNCKQIYDFKLNKNGHCERLKNYVQGGDNVFNVIEIWLERIHND